LNIDALENTKGLKLSKVSQIGIVVPDIGKAVTGRFFYEICPASFCSIKET
jgi:hypothetical protein